MKNRILLNVGCGACRPSDWINTDISLNAFVQRIPVFGNFIARNLIKSTYYESSNVRYMNLNKRWNFTSQSVDVVYASHVFEHLSGKTAELFLNESLRVLKNGGVLRLVVPDLYQLSKQYVTEYENGQTDASHKFLHTVNLHRRRNSPAFLKNFIKEIIYLMQGYPHLHKYMYDRYSLESKLAEEGFKEIAVMNRGSSRITEIKDVESNLIESNPSLHVECIK